MTDPANLLERQTQLANFLVAGWPALEIPGLPAVSAAAAVGNATQENAAKSVTVGALDHGSNGLFQWRLERLTNMQAFGDKNFGGWQSIEAQAAFFSYECKGWYKPLWVDLSAGLKSLATLTANICDQYEKPAAASANVDSRIKYAADFMASWKPDLHQGDVPTPPVVLPPAPVPTAPITPATTALTEGNIAVLDALIAAMNTSLTPTALRALASAILKELP